MKEDWCVDQLRTIRNLVDIAEFIHEHPAWPYRGNHLHTVLELIFLEAQDLIGDTCVVKPDEPEV